MPTVNITVTRNGIVVDKDPVKVPWDQRDVPIDWCINTPGWQFTKDGIEIKKNYLQFKGKRRYENSTQFRWVSRNSHKKKRLYHYTINLTNGTNQLSRDPGIQNGGHK